MTTENTQSSNPMDSKEVNLTLTVAEINVILAGLGELPAKFSISLIDKIKGQATMQLQETDQNVQ